MRGNREDDRSRFTGRMPVGRFFCTGQLEGIIIYPVVNAVLCEDLILAGNEIRVCTLEMNAPWAQVSLQMKEISEGKPSPAH